MSARLELWGGLECSIARIGDAFRDQFFDTGHRSRLADLDAVARLGLKTLRYPVLWESVSPDDPDLCDWSWHDARMEKLRALGITPIIGLVHHGSGPRYTDLLDKGFAEGLARHAARVAARYPWLRRFTPVNEPLTTARFSGLYGHWYPHGTGYGTFLPILVNEIRATQRAMQEIRKLIPDAQLVQTEDLGKTFATPHLAYQADHENERRWLGFDLLCGHVNAAHPFWPILLDNGVAAHDLHALLEAPCPPDILGMNHYLTSERFIDENVGLYPASTIGGNGRDFYADIEAVRADLPDADCGPAARLREAWTRYHIPLAITEAHLGCTREEQLRWLMAMWRAAETVRGEGCDIRAVTIWSMFGAVDWNSLLTHRADFYEPGAFDTRGENARQTALARAAGALAHSGNFDHPAIDTEGWWQRDDRFLLPVRRQPTAPRAEKPFRPILIIGDGRLGRAVADACALRNLAHVVTAYHAGEAKGGTGMDALIDSVKPWAIVNCCGYSAAICARAAPEQCFAANVTAATELAAHAARLGLPYVMISTDLVFDGARDDAYVERDRTRPLGIFGATKREAELRVATAHEQALILRTGPLFGPTSRDRLAAALHHAAREAGVRPDRNLIISPTFVPDLANALLDLLIDDETGIWHLANDGAIDAEDVLRRMEEQGRAHSLQNGRSGCNLALTSKRGILLPTLTSALDRLSAVA